MTTYTASGSILIVDDLVDNLRVLTKLLTEHGYVVRAANTGQEALASMQSMLPDLVLLDIKLPDIDGFEICTQLKSNELTRDVPVLFLSALDSSADFIRGFEVGGVDYVIKPFKTQELLARVQTHIELSLLHKSIKQQSFDLDQSNKKLLIEIARGQRQENALKKQNILLAAIINSPKDIIIFSIDKNYCYTTFNERHRTEMKTVWNVDINIGMNLLDCMALPELRDMAKQSIDKAMEGDSFTEIQHQTDLGNYFELSWNPIYFNEDVIGVTAFIRDITERKLLKNRLMESKALLSETEKMGKVGGWVFDVKTLTQTWTDEIFRILEIDFSKGEPRVPEGIEFISPEFLPMAEKAIRRAIEYGEPFDQEWIVITAKGNKRWVNSLGKANKEKGVIISISGSFQDITERKQSELLLLEKKQEIESQNEEYQQINEELTETNEELMLAKKRAEESDRLKTAFLHNMSHEIRTPMNAIIGFSELLSEQYNNKLKLNEFSIIINQSCNDLLDIVNNILDISKIETGQLSVSFEECSLNSLFSELSLYFKEYQKRFEKEQIEFSIQALCDPADSIIITDKAKLKQIFINLIGNAFKFTEKGVVLAGCRLNASGQLLFFVSDTGSGIPLEKQNLIFERFSQLDPGMDRLVSGNGLGLSIVKGLVDLLEGSIWLDSEPKKGTTFYFSFPYKTIESKQEPLRTISSNEIVFSGQTILIVEDDIYNTAYLKEILSGKGFHVIHSMYGKEAVQISLSQPLDLVLMDIRLPDIDGYEATRQIKQHKPSLKIIAQTAYATNNDKQNAIEAGCDEYISKPVKREQLLSMINKQLTNLKI